MPSTAKTHHLKLNQWSLEDKPQMEDFNQDNQLLEDSISAIGKEIADFNKDNQLLENSLSAIRKELEDINASLASKANITPPEWIAPELLNGAEGYIPIRYRRELNTVYIEGWVRGVEINKEIFVLPESFRPAYLAEICVCQSSYSRENATARLSVSNQGVVKITAVYDMDFFLERGASLHCSFTAQ